jgi:hypothetical protein
MSRQNGRGSLRRRSRPYRDSALLYALFGVIVVVITLATGGGFARGLIAGVAAFVLATGWTWWRLRASAGDQRR